jgi:hypothetical protein
MASVNTSHQPAKKQIGKGLDGVAEKLKRPARKIFYYFNCPVPHVLSKIYPLTSFAGKSNLLR